MPVSHGTRSGKLISKGILALTAIMLAGCSIAATPTPIPTRTLAPTATATATYQPATTPTPEVTETVEVLEPLHVITSRNQLESADTVFEGGTAQYAKRILAAYRAGQIENLDVSIQPAAIERTPSDDPTFLRQGYAAEVRPVRFLYGTINANPVRVPTNAYDVFRGATIVKDGQGGLQIIQVWLQSDGTPGLVWYHLSAAMEHSRPSQFYGTLDEAFGSRKRIVVLPMKIRDFATCRSINFIAKDDCRVYMDQKEIARRDAAIIAWAKDGMIPAEIRDGQLQFLALTTY